MSGMYNKGVSSGDSDSFGPMLTTAHLAMVRQTRRDSSSDSNFPRVPDPIVPSRAFCSAVCCSLVATEITGTRGSISMIMPTEKKTPMAGVPLQSLNSMLLMSG